MSSGPSSLVPGSSGAGSLASRGVALLGVSYAFSSSSLFSGNLCSGPLASSSGVLSSGNDGLSSGSMFSIFGASSSSSLPFGNWFSAGNTASLLAAAVVYSSEHAKILAQEAEVVELKAMISGGHGRQRFRLFACSAGRKGVFMGDWRRRSFSVKQAE